MSALFWFAIGYDEPAEKLVTVRGQVVRNGEPLYQKPT